MNNTPEPVKSKIFLKYLLYSLYITLTVAIMFLAINQKHIRNFFINTENQTFDVRQNIIAKHKHVNKDIVIITIDDASYEYALEKYGDWPISRGIYADLIEYIETQNPSAIAFDLMFVKSLKGSHNDDIKLANTFAKYDNVFTSINFDDQDTMLRKPVDLPDYLKAKVDNESRIDLKNKQTGPAFTNCRAIINEIIDATPNIGHINLVRDEDGIARNLPPFAVYKNEYYPHLALKVALKYLQKKESTNYNTDEFKINKAGEIILGKRIIPLVHNGTAILNWYGKSGINNKDTSEDTFEYVPFWHVDKTMYEKRQLVKNDFFKDKIVYIGTSAMSLFDLKSVPTDNVFPGVEIHATFINNIIDNNFIKRVPFETDLLICLALSLFVGLMVLRLKSTILSSFITIITGALFIVTSTLLMRYCNLWIGLVLPILSIAIVFTAVYIAKYILKSRDFEYQYALATTDGLTELYNHRYFQEQMIHSVETSKRYNSEFSLIIIDIDFFKKFNDNYGHQSGDAVLKQVAQILKKNVRATDIVCRYGGEEMAIILTNTNNKDAMTTAQKICDAVAQKPFKLVNDAETHVTISLGVATFPKDGETPQAMIKYADTCLYKAKENGRNQIGHIE